MGPSDSWGGSKRCPSSARASLGVSALLCGSDYSGNGRSLVVASTLAVPIALVVLGVAFAAARTRPEREAQVVFYGVVELISVIASIAMSLRLLLLGSRGVELVVGLIALGLTVAAIQAFTQLRAIRAEE